MAVKPTRRSSAYTLSQNFLGVPLGTAGRHDDGRAIRGVCVSHGETRRDQRLGSGTGVSRSPPVGLVLDIRKPPAPLRVEWMLTHV
jgi:hypothetical protein